MQTRRASRCMQRRRSRARPEGVGDVASGDPVTVHAWVEGFINSAKVEDKGVAFDDKGADGEGGGDQQGGMASGGNPARPASPTGPRVWRNLRWRPDEGHVVSTMQLEGAGVVLRARCFGVDHDVACHSLVLYSTSQYAWCERLEVPDIKDGDDFPAFKNPSGTTVVVMYGVAMRSRVLALAGHRNYMRSGAEKQFVNGGSEGKVFGYHLLPLLRALLTY